MTTHPWMPWFLFHLFLLFALALDLGIFHRRSEVISFRQSLLWSSIWALLAVGFGAGMYHFRGPEVGLAFFAGYLLEWSLSVDNLFVFISVFSFFAVPAALQHRVLFWGVLGALVMRAVCIFSGVALLQRFHWLLGVFGVFLLITGIKTGCSEAASSDPREHFLVRQITRLLPFSSSYAGDHFWVRIEGRRVGTPLLLTLLVIEVADLLFAMDSIPAVLGISSDPFILYTSNIFAILGLRSLYFALSGLVSLFRLLRFGLAGVLIFIGGKLCLSPWIEVPTRISLLVVLGFLGVSMIASIATKGRQ